MFYPVSKALEVNYKSKPTSITNNNTNDEIFVKRAQEQSIEYNDRLSQTLNEQGRELVYEILAKLLSNKCSCNLNNVRVFVIFFVILIIWYR